MDKIERNRAAFWKSAQRHGPQILVEGSFLIVLGWLAVVLPMFVPAVVNAIIGWLFLVSGLIGLVTTAAGRHDPGFWWSLLSAILAIAVGATLLQRPTVEPIWVIYLLTIFFVIEGIATIMFALDYKRKLAGRWEWMVASGFVDLALAALVIFGLPETAPWTVGLLVGVNMIFGGSALVAMAIFAHTTRAPRSAHLQRDGH